MIALGNIQEYNLLPKPDHPYSVRSSTCTSTCGDGVRVTGEECDNGNQPGCSCCKVDKGYSCQEDAQGASSCSTNCGDGVTAATELCDNGNKLGCSVNRQPDTNYKCLFDKNLLAMCELACGDRFLDSGEGCDNGNQAGCKQCVVELGYTCNNNGTAKQLVAMLSRPMFSHVTMETNSGVQPSVKLTKDMSVVRIAQENLSADQTAVTISELALKAVTMEN